MENNNFTSYQPKSDANLMGMRIGSAIVILSYFLVWEKRWKHTIIGFESLWQTIKELDSIIKSIDKMGFMGLLILLWLFAPIICHGINLLISFTNRNSKHSFRLLLFPLLVWIGLAGYIFITIMNVRSEFGEITAEKQMEMLKDSLGWVFYHPGTIVAMVGMVISPSFAWRGFSDAPAVQNAPLPQAKSITTICPHCLAKNTQQTGNCAQCGQAL